MTPGEDPPLSFPLPPRRARFLSQRYAVGIFLLFLILMGGRLVRRHLLLGPEDQWRQYLWLDELLQSAEPAVAAEVPEKPRLTGPLPINSCSRDSLTLLPGVGPVLADRIDAVRREGVLFREPQDLEVVKGIGPALSARLGALVVYSVPELVAAGPDSLPAQDLLPANSR